MLEPARQQVVLVISRADCFGSGDARSRHHRFRAGFTSTLSIAEIMGEDKSRRAWMLIDSCSLSSLIVRYCAVSALRDKIYPAIWFAPEQSGWPPARAALAVPLMGATQFCSD